MAGRKPKPTHLKLLGGNAGKRARNGREPKPPKGVPPCPKHLSATAKAAWKRVGADLERMGVLTLADGLALELLVSAYAEYRDAVEAITQAGDATYSTMNEAGSIMHRARPEVAMRNDAWRRVAALLAEFGLTPSSRTKVHVAGEGERDPLEEFLGSGTAGAPPVRTPTGGKRGRRK